MSRYLEVVSEDLLSMLREWQEECAAVSSLRAEFLEQWGSPKILIDGQGGRKLCGLADPRLMDPPRTLGKGWRKLSSHPGFVEPTSTETRGLLRPFHLPDPIKFIVAVLNRLADVDPYNSERIYGEHRNDKRIVWFADTNGKHYCYWLGQIHLAGRWFVSVSDPCLRFDDAPGLKAIKEWEFLKLVEESKGVQA